MYRLAKLFFDSLIRLMSSRRDLLMENLALRQQLAVRQAGSPKPRRSMPDKLFWVLARRLWSHWKQSLLVVTPETVVRWHRAGPLLEFPLQNPQATRQNENFQRGSQPDFSDGRGESNLGCSPYPRRTPDARFRRI